MKKDIFFISRHLFLFVILFMLNAASPVRAVEQIERPPQTEVQVNLRLVDREKKTLTGEKKVMVEVSRGGLKDPTILSSGLSIRDGIGQFVYITPSVPGPAEVKIVDPETGEILEKILFVITELTPVFRKNDTVLVTETIGRVEIQPGARILRPGEKLAAGVMVTTGTNSWLNLELFDGLRVIVQPGSVLRFVAIKRGVTLGEKELCLNLVAGRIFFATQDYREGSSIFQVRTPTKTVYAQGSTFEVSVSEIGTEVATYQGEVLLEDVESGLLFPVVQGQKALLSDEGGTIPSYSLHHLTPEMREDILHSESLLNKERIPRKAMFPVAQYQTGAAFKSTGGLNYSVLSIKPQFFNVFNSSFSFGFDLPIILYHSGWLDFGSANLESKVGPLLDWLNYENEVIFLDYDYQEELTYGFGLLFGDYVNERTRRTRLGLRGIDGLRIEALCPWNIRSAYPWEFDHSSLYAYRIEDSFSFDLVSLQLGLTYVVDYDFKKNLGPLLGSGIAEQGAAFDAGLFLTEAFQPYFEGALLKDYGYGIEAGALGQVGFLSYRGAYRYLGEKFHPNYFGGDYDINKTNILLDLITGTDEGSGTLLYGKPLAKLDGAAFMKGMGYLMGIGISAGEVLSLDLSYEDANRKDQYFPILTVKVDLSLPELGPIPSLSAGFDYHCYQFTGFNELLNINTVFSHYIEIMLDKGVYAAITSTYLPFSTGPYYLRDLSMEVRIKK